MLLAAPPWAPAAEVDPPGGVSPPVPAAVRGATAPVTRRVETLRQLSGQSSLVLRGTDGSATVAFGSRRDTLVVGAKLHLTYSHSPALIMSQSHLKVLLNDELVATLRFSADTAGAPVRQTIEIDPRLVTDFNRLRLQFIGHYATGCEDLLHSSLWAEISGNSELELSLRRVRVVNDLAALPEPFFDARELRRLDLAFVFPARPSADVLRPAALVASWFGSLAHWRGARFTANFDEPLPGHAVVFATNTSRPAFLDALPPVQQPTLAIIDHPSDGVSKLLLVRGRDGAQLAQAALALVLGHKALSGPSALVREVELPPPRLPYDAPRWVRIDRATTLGELVADPRQLQSVGHSAERVKIALRIPPDLFTWRSRGVELDLRFRHNAPPLAPGASRLTVSVDGELIRSFDLDHGKPATGIRPMRVALLESGLASGEGRARLPAFMLGARNQLELGFDFGVPREGECRDRFVPNVRGEIDPDSTIDFSAFPHYTTLPQLSHFATTGFPFTRLADLAQTVVVLPAAPGAADLSVLLTLMGRLGESTGYPALRVRVANAGDANDADGEGGLRDADLLVIGSAPGQRLLERWRSFLPASVAPGERRLNFGSVRSSLVGRWLGQDADEAQGSAGAAFVQDGVLGALLGLQNPLSPGRSVVVLTASQPGGLAGVLDALDDAGKVAAMHGSVVLVNGDHVSGLMAGPTYTVGSLPPWTAVWYPVSRHPLLVALLALVVAVLLAALLARALRAARARRLAHVR